MDYNKKQKYYDLFDFNAKGNPFVLNKIVEGSKVLDVGCGAGNLGLGLKEKRCQAWGMDISEESVRKSRRKISNVFRVDLEEADKWPFTQKFDYVVLADILEHLRNPEKVLKLAKKHLKSNGRIVVSIPNVAFVSIRLQLLMGKFEYTDWGICDSTHVHFYTLESISKLLKDAGFSITSVEGFPLTIRKFVWLTYPLTQLFKTLLARQFIITART
jgi:methionine biosynthesis protein MetW